MTEPVVAMPGTIRHLQRQQSSASLTGVKPAEDTAITQLHVPSRVEDEEVMAFFIFTFMFSFYSGTHALSERPRKEAHS